MTPDLADRWEAAMVPNYGTPELMLVEGQGAHVTDSHGTTYLDLLAGLAVNILGHRHPAVVDAVCQQVGRLGHVSNLYATPPALELSQRLSAMTGGKQAIMVNSGSEANEAAYKIVRRHAHAQGRQDGTILAFQGSFHGRTTAALSLTGQPKKHEGFTPFPPTVTFVPYNDPAALEAAFEAHDVVGVFAEAVQGEGGIVPMDQATADALSRLTREHGSVLVLDEVQTGLGRTGATFAHEPLGLEPDVLTLAKALGGGLPIGATLAAPELAELMGPGSHGCTFGGNPVASAAANAVLDVYEKEDLAGRAKRLGNALGQALEDQGLAWRGKGLLVGLPLGAPKASQVVGRAQAERLLIGQAGSDVARLAPPLIVDEAELLEAAPVIAGCIEQVAPPEQ